MPFVIYILMPSALPDPVESNHPMSTKDVESLLPFQLGLHTISTHASNLYRAVMQCARATEMAPYHIYFVRVPTPVTHGCWTPPCYRRLVAVRVFTHVRVPYFSLMCQRPLWSKCQRLTHLRIYWFGPPLPKI